MRHHAGQPQRKRRPRAAAAARPGRKHLSCLAALVIVLFAASCAPAAPTTDGRPTLLDDDFARDSGLWETFDEAGASAAITGGRLVIRIQRASSVGLAVAAVSLADFDLTVRTTQLGGSLANGYGVIFRYLDEDNFYRFDISGDGLWGVSRRGGDRWISVVDLSPSPAIRPGFSTNTLRVVARGGEFDLYANGTWLGHASESHLPLGRIGVFASTFDEPQAEIAFDDVLVVEP